MTRSLSATLLVFAATACTSYVDRPANRFRDTSVKDEGVTQSRPKAAPDQETCADG